MTEERDLAHEADMERLRREQLRADISPEEANEEMAERDALEQAGWDDDEGMGDPDEYDEHYYCICSVEHILEELDTNQCYTCGREIT